MATFNTIIYVFFCINFFAMICVSFSFLFGIFPIKNTSLLIALTILFFWFSIFVEAGYVFMLFKKTIQWEVAFPSIVACFGSTGLFAEANIFYQKERKTVSGSGS